MLRKRRTRQRSSKESDKWQIEPAPPRTLNSKLIFNWLKFPSVQSIIKALQKNNKKPILTIPLNFSRITSRHVRSATWWRTKQKKDERRAYLREIIEMASNSGTRWKISMNLKAALTQSLCSSLHWTVMSQKRLAKSSRRCLTSIVTKFSLSTSTLRGSPIFVSKKTSLSSHASESTVKTSFSLKW